MMSDFLSIMEKLMFYGAVAFFWIIGLVVTVVIIGFLDEIGWFNFFDYDD